MTTKIRPGNASDVPLLAAIESSGDQLFASAGHPEFVGGQTVRNDEALAAIAKGWLLVAEQNGQVVGFALLERSGEQLQLHQISVHASAGRQGIGRQLMDVVIHKARDAGEPNLVLDTQADIAWNMPWYQALGFQVVPASNWTSAMQATTKQQQQAGLDWSTRVHMQLDL